MSIMHEAARRRRRPPKKPMYVSKSPNKGQSEGQLGSAGHRGGGSARGVIVMSAPPCDGGVIGVVKNYRGLNTSCGEERTLRRRDGRHSKLSATTAVPEWVGPGHYAGDSLASGETTERPPSSFQVSFRNTGRVIKNAEYYKAARIEQLSKSSECSAATADPRPSYSAAATCTRGHDQDQDLGECWGGSGNPWSSSSALSTIGRPASQSGRLSPQSVHIHSPKQSTCAYESVISEFIGLPAELSNSSHNSIRMDDSVDRNTLDSLVLKAADVHSRRYLNNDFAMGGLDLQEDIPVLVLDQAGEAVLDRGGDGGGGGGSSAAGAGGATAAAPKKTHQSRSKAAGEGRPRSKAQKTLNHIKHDLSQNRQSKLRDQNVSFTDSLSFIIDDWQASENVNRPGPGKKYASHRKDRGGGQQGAPNAVNLDQLLMDDTGMSFEEAKCLVEEYSESLNL
jgi:hypothetical protein